MSELHPIGTRPASYNDSTWDPVLMFAFSPDGNGVLVKNGVWDAATGEVLFTIDKLKRPIFGPDGKRLADGRKIWDAQPGLELLSLGQEGIGGRGSFAFSPDGHRLAVFKAHGEEVAIYDATPLPERP